MRLRIHLLLATVAIASAAWFVTTPYLADNSMKAAIESGDSPTFNDHVDFPALKDTLKGTINAKLISATSKGKPSSTYDKLGAPLEAAMLGHLVEAFVTLESVAVMMKGDKPRLVRVPKTSQSDHEPVDRSIGR